jgi:O-antigen ligase
MSSAVVRLQHPAGSAATPVWVALPIVLFGAGMAVAAWFGDQWPLTLLVLLFVGAAFALVLNRPHIGISLFLTTFLINYPGVARGVGPLTINNLLGVMFLGLLAWNYYTTRDTWYLREPLVWMLIAIGGVLVASTVAAEYGFPDAHIQRLIERPIGVTAGFDFTRRWLFQHFSRVAFVLFVLTFVRTPAQLRTVFVTLLVCILAAVPPALVQFMQVGTGEEFRIDVEIVNWADNENRFAFGCILGVSFLLHLWMTSRSTVTKAATAMGILLLLPLVLLAASRSGFLGMCLLGLLILSGAFGAKSKLSSGARLAGVAGFAGIALLTFFFLVPPKAQERILNVNPFAAERLEGSTSTAFRAAAIEHSFDLIRMNPILGVGIGNFRWVNRYYHGFFKPPHNSYLWAAAEGGLVLLAAYLLLFRQLWRRFGRLRAAYQSDAELPLFAHWLRVYMVLFLFFSFFADVWLEEHVFLFVAAAILLERWRREGVAATGAKAQTAADGATTPGPAPMGPARGLRPATALRTV